MSPCDRKIRVCHLASGDLWAGAEAHLASLLPELAKLPGISVHAILLNEGLLAQKLRASHLPVSIVAEERLSTLSLIDAVVRLLHETRADFLHTHGYKQNILGTVSARLAKARWIVRTEHGVYERVPGLAGLRMRGYRLLDSLATRYCSAIVAVSDQLAEHWRVRLKGQGPRVAVVRNGVPVHPHLESEAISRIRVQLGIGEDQVVFGTLGRMVPIKGLSDLLEAAVLVHRRDPRSTFLIAGDGPLRGFLEARAAELSLHGVVRFLGFTQEPAEFLAALDVFILPSLGEGVPMALLEALSLGKPVVATAVGGVAELLSPGVHALLVQPGAPAELARACEQLVGDPGLRAALGRQARSLVREQLSAERMATEVHGLYCRLMKQCNPVGDDK